MEPIEHCRHVKVNKKLPFAKTRLRMMLVHAAFTALFFFQSALNTHAGLYTERRRLFSELQWVLIEIINLDNEKDHRKEFTAHLKSDILSVLRSAGIRAKITENERDVGKAPHLKIRVHKIRLERTVFLSVIELVTPKSVSSNENAEDYSVRTSRLSNLIETVRPKIKEELEEMIRWYTD